MIGDTAGKIADAAFTSQNLRILHTRTALQLATLCQAVAPEALRRGGHPAAPGIAADIGRVLLDVRRVMAREPGWDARLGLEPAPTWAALNIKLAFAARALGWFHELYLSPPIDDGEDEDDDTLDPPLSSADWR
jgi:hypothetical protein